MKLTKFVLFLLYLSSFQIYFGSCQLNSQLLNWIPQITVFDNFLSTLECDLLIEAAKNHSKYVKDSQESQSVYLQEYPKLRKEFKDIEERIGAVTGEPPHPDEEPINIHHNKRVNLIDIFKSLTSPDEDYERKQECLSSSENYHNNATQCNLMVHSVHHDKVQKEFSSVTVIVYLNNVEVGGGTVWPCMSQFSSSQQQTSSACESAFTAGARWFDGDKAVVKDIYKKHRVTEQLHRALQFILLSAHVGCIPQQLASQPSWVERRAVRTVAKKGSAVVFHHNRQDLSAEPLTWHAGCQPLSGDKWTLQKFKELHPRFRTAQLKKQQTENSKRNNNREL